MIRVVKGLLVLALGIVLGLARPRAVPLSSVPSDEPRTLHAGPTLATVQALAELTTLRVELADVLVTRIDGRLGGVEAAVLVRGEFTVATDLSAAKFESVDPVAKTSVLVLPMPRASPPRVDHARSTLVAIREGGLWQLVPGDEATVAIANAAFGDAQRLLAMAAQQDARVNAARHQAEQVLGAFFAGQGWRVSVLGAAGPL